MANREIKFRAWDFKAKEMHHWNTGFNYRWFECQQKKDCHSLMQYTGLKDKNGKEIYEGDIWIVRGLTAPNPVEYRLLSFNGGVKCIGFNVPIPSEQCEVIGNIYENGDLLK